MPDQENNLKKVGEQVDLNKFVDGEGGIFSVRQLENIRGWNNIQYGAGLSEKNVGSKKVPIIIAPILEQDEILSQIEQSFSLIENSQNIVNSTLQTLETMRMSVLKQAFEGKLVPQDPNDEPASVLLERIKKEK